MLCDHGPMLIAAPCVVSLSWRLENAQDELIDALEGQEASFATRVQLEPEQAFGEYRPELVCFEDRALFPERLEPGMQFDGLPEGCATEGMPQDAIYTVTEVYPNHVVLDGNHPLAGMALRLALQVTDVRRATPEEIEQGSVGNGAVSLLGSAPPHARLH